MTRDRDVIWNRITRLAPATILLLAATCLAGPGVAAEPEPPPDLAIVDVSVIPMDEEQVLADHVVLIHGSRIVAVGPRDSTPVPDGTETISGRGGFVIPGLIDLHVHLSDPTDFPLYLANGVTRIRNAGGLDLHMKWREDVRAGRLLGPRIHSCGPPIYDVETAAAAREVVAKQAAAGWDCIKIYDRIQQEAYIALVAAAREHGLLASGHIPRNLTWQDMLEAGPDSVDHAEEFLYSPLSGHDIPVIAKRMRKEGSAIISTLITYDLIGRQVFDLEQLARRPEMAFTSPIERRVRTARYNSYLARFDLGEVPDLRRLLTTQKRILKRLHQEGVRVLVGTDAGPGMAIPGYSIHQELIHLVDAGLTPYEALLGATRHAAEYLRVGDQVGTIEKGFDADLVLLMGNPLEDVSNSNLLMGVVVQGRWLSREDLAKRVQTLRTIFAPEEELIAIYETDGVAALVAHVEGLLETGGLFPIRWRTLNELAYQIRYIEDRPDDAVAVFKLATHVWTDSWSAWDSLAEALEATGDHERAESATRRAADLKADSGSPLLK